MASHRSSFAAKAELTGRITSSRETGAVMDTIVVGGGIAGLTMALSLHQKGLPVRVYEAVSDVRPLGVGINLQPGAVRELTELGLGPQLASAGISIETLALFNKLGQLIWREPRGTAAGYRWPQYAIHRGRLQAILLEAVRDRIGSDNFRSGLRLQNIEQIRDRVAADFCRTADGSIVRDCADMIVGADGIHSAVRRYIHPASGAPQFGGQILWRSAVEGGVLLDGRTMIIAGHADQRIIVYPIAMGSAPGRFCINWICQKAAPASDPAVQDWNKRTSPSAVLADFEAWRFDWLNLPQLVRASDAIFEFPLVDRDPVGCWSRGRITLIGDAAHPMQPIGGQAGSQAIIDARVLTDALISQGDVVGALQHYDAQRRPVMNDITLRNRQLGPEAALQVVEERAPQGFEEVTDVISIGELEQIASSYSKAAGLDVETVNLTQF
jgi:5-methylphenazine-1-carboxylate 1-monooxygenase